MELPSHNPDKAAKEHALHSPEAGCAHVLEPTLHSPGTQLYTALEPSWKAESTRTQVSLILPGL